VLASSESCIQVRKRGLAIMSLTLGLPKGPHKYSWNCDASSASIVRHWACFIWRSFAASHLLGRRNQHFHALRIWLTRMSSNCITESVRMLESLVPWWIHMLLVNDFLSYLEITGKIPSQGLRKSRKRKFRRLSTSALDSPYLRDFPQSLQIASSDSSGEA
jgi:hypothetical protein